MDGDTVKLLLAAITTLTTVVVYLWRLILTQNREIKETVERQHAETKKQLEATRKYLDSTEAKLDECERDRAALQSQINELKKQVSALSKEK